MAVQVTGDDAIWSATSTTSGRVSASCSWSVPSDGPSTYSSTRCGTGACNSGCQSRWRPGWATLWWAWASSRRSSHTPASSTSSGRGSLTTTGDQSSIDHASQLSQWVPPPSSCQASSPGSSGSPGARSRHDSSVSVISSPAGAGVQMRGGGGAPVRPHPARAPRCAPVAARTATAAVAAARAARRALAGVRLGEAGDQPGVTSGRHVVHLPPA